jgi:hypothetical protein
MPLTYEQLSVITERPCVMIVRHILIRDFHRYLDRDLLFQRHNENKITVFEAIWYNVKTV